MVEAGYKYLTMEFLQFNAPPEQLHKRRPFREKCCVGKDCNNIFKTEKFVTLLYNGVIQ